MCPLCRAVVLGVVKRRGREDSGVLLVSFRTCLGASLASTGGALWVLSMSSETRTWTLQPKLSPTSYNLLGQGGSAGGSLPCRLPFPVGSLPKPPAWVSGRILCTLGLGPPWGRDVPLRALRWLRCLSQRLAQPGRSMSVERMHRSTKARGYLRAPQVWNSPSAACHRWSCLAPRECGLLREALREAPFRTHTPPSAGPSPGLNHGHSPF